MQWIAGWNKRIKFEIDHTKVDEDLTDFPVLVNLDTTYSGVFNELGNNYKKISFINPSTGEEYYCEVERWDSTNKSAQLWVKIPSVVSGTNTSFYMLFDGNRPDNSNYVGSTGSDAGKNVWDENYVAVYHMSQDPSTGGACILDSTSNENHGTPHGSMTSGDLVDANIGKGLDFDGSDDYIDIGNNIIPGSSSFMIETLTKASDYKIVFGGGGTSGETWGLQCRPNVLYVVTNGTLRTADFEDTTLESWAYICFFRESTTIQAYVNGSLDNAKDNAASGDLRGTSSGYLEKTVIGSGWNNGSVDNAFDGIISDIRISTTIRNSSWIKTTYYSNFDTLLIKGTIETVPSTELDYANKIKILIPHYSENDDLYDFPVLINLCDAAGKNNADLTDVFENLGSSVNRKKIAITDYSKVSQLYVEIERWSQAEQSAQLWVKVPFISRTCDTELYLYYDPEKDDNYLMVGDTGSLAAQKVWDENYKIVYHLSQNPSGGVDCVLDSTANENHGTPNGGMTSSSVVNANVGKGLEFDGINDRIISKNNVNIAGGVQRTLEITANVSSVSTYSYFMVWGDNSEGGRSGLITNTSCTNGVYYSVSSGDKLFDAGDLCNNFNYLAIAVPDNDDLTNARGFKNTAEMSTTSLSTRAINTTDSKLFVGSKIDNTLHIKGILRELRVSNVRRSDAWLKTTYKSNFDSLLIYDTLESSWLKAYENGVLSPWANRVKIEIDNSKVDEVLEDFPILINIDSDSGYNNKNLTNIIASLSETITIHEFIGENNDPPDPKLWDYNNAGLCHIYNNSLFVQSDNTGNVVVTSYFYVNGDFDIESYIYDVTASSSSSMVHITVKSVSAPESYAFIGLGDSSHGFWTRIQTPGSSCCNNNTYSRTGTAAYVRLKRTGSTIYLYRKYNIDDSWTLLRQGTFNNHVCKIELRTYRNSTSITVKGNIDYVKINSGFYGWDTSKHPNCHKIAVTIDDGTTQLPVEIERWDQHYTNAQLWTKVPIVKPCEKTTLYLYYDKDKSDNTDYVGYTGSTPAKKVWDSNFVVVQHASNKNKDSSNYGIDGTLNGTTTVDFLIGKALKFDGDDDYLNLGSPSQLDNIYDFTLSTWFKLDGYGEGGYGRILDNKKVYINFDSTYKRLSLTQAYSSNHAKNKTPDNSIPLNEYKHLSVIWDRDNPSAPPTVLLDGTNINAYLDSAGSGSVEDDSAKSMYIGNNVDGTRTLDGALKEIRISNIQRTIYWEKTTYYSNFDTLLYYYDKQTYEEYSFTPTYYFDGHVYDNGTPVQTDIFLYRTSTGELVDNTFSNQDGYYKLLTPYNESHMLVCINEPYKPIIKHDIYPTL